MYMEIASSPEQPGWLPYCQFGSFGQPGAEYTPPAALDGPGQDEITAPGNKPEEALVPGAIPSPGSGLYVPPNMHELLADGLIPSGLPGGETAKYYVRGYPDLLVRRSAGLDVDELRDAHNLVTGLKHYGVHVLPSKVYEGPEPYAADAVTARVHGEALLDMWERGPDEVLVSRVDQLFANVARWLHDETVSGHDTVADVHGLEQYMHGTVSWDPQAKIWLVDLPEYTYDSTRYATSAIMLTNGIIDAENAAGVRLPRARAGIERLITLLPRFSRAPSRVEGLIAGCLGTNELCSMDVRIL